MRRLDAIRTDMRPRRVDAPLTSGSADMLDAVAADPRTETIDTIRALAMDAVQKANAGHPGTAMALAPLAYLLYRDVLRHNPADPALARPRPLRPLGGPRLHPPVRGAPPRGLRPHARRPAAVPAVGLAHAGPSRARAHRRASRRRPARSARGSRTASGWRSRSASSPTATTGRTTRSSTRGSTRSAPTAT